MTAELRPAFDPGDPFDAVAEAFKNEVAEAALRMMKVTIYRELEPHQQLEALIVGTLTGLIGSAFAHAQPQSHDEIMKYIAEIMPLAREQAEAAVGSVGAVPAEE